MTIDLSFGFFDLLAENGNAPDLLWVENFLEGVKPNIKKFEKVMFVLAGDDVMSLREYYDDYKEADFATGIRIETDI